MKAILKTGGLTIELEGATQKDLWKAIAEIQEVFGEHDCGLCKKTNIVYRVRVVDGDEYYEMKCMDCGAILAFGQSKKSPGKLFPIRKVTPDGRHSRKDGEYDREHRGWTKWKGEPKTATDTQKKR